MNGRGIIRIALLGAESTGKTVLALALAERLRGLGHTAVAVPELLREWCDAACRTPRADEQRGIAQAQADRIDNAELALHASPATAPSTASSAPPSVPAPTAIVIADTTPLMIAVYSDLLFGDRSLYPFALEHQRGYALTLLTGLDLPWVADGLQRDGPHVRAPVDALLRAALDQGGIGYQICYGSGPARLDNALAALAVLDERVRAGGITGLPPRPLPSNANAHVRWVCDKCSDPDCEHRLFGRLRQRPDC